MKWLVLLIIALVIPAFFVLLWLRNRANKRKPKRKN
jgi:hypothetical protein